MPHVPAQLADLLGDSLGIAAILLVIGWIMLRWQQDRQRFALMQTALEKGITQFPNAPPFWLVSLRQGLTMLALGFALMVVGAGVFFVGHHVPTPTSAMLASGTGGQGELRPADSGAPDEGPPPRPQDQDRPERMSPRDRGPFDSLAHAQGRPFDLRPRPEPERRPPPSPELERWHHAQIEQISGLVATGIGLILVVVGLMRVAFARTERLYSTDAARGDGGF